MNTALPISNRYDTQGKRVFIYGSCVTRDGVDVAWDEFGLELAGYVARQSLISAAAPANPYHFDTSSITSPFQRRMVEGDVRGSALKNILDNANNFDHVLWDLTDERLGVSSVPGGGYITRVVNYSNGIYVGPGAIGAPIKLGTSAHSDAWKRAADLMITRLDAAGLLGRIIVNGTPWAERDDNGDRIDYPVFEPWRFNELINDYYAHLSAGGMRIVVPESDPIARRDHKWGPAPFHYTDETYRSLLRSAFP